MKKGVVRIVLGSILIILQVMSVVGNALAGTDTSIQLSFDSISSFMYDIIFLASYFFVGIVGVILLTSGLVARYKTDSPSNAEVATPDVSPEVELHHSRVFSKAALIIASCVVVIGLAAFGIYHFCVNKPTSSSEPKDVDYLYDWLTEHGTLVDGTILQYSETDSNGNEFILRYNTNYVESLRWQVSCSTKDDLGRTVITTLYLFPDDKEASSHISVFGLGKYEDYYRSLEFYHDPAKFTKNSPIEIGELSGSTVHVPDAEKTLISEILALNTICEDRAQGSLCSVLDWLKNSFCPAANMSMSDFVYEKY